MNGVQLNSVHYSDALAKAKAIGVTFRETAIRGAVPTVGGLGPFDVLLRHKRGTLAFVKTVLVGGWGARFIHGVVDAEGQYDSRAAAGRQAGCAFGLDAGKEAGAGVRPNPQVLNGQSPPACMAVRSQASGPAQVPLVADSGHERVADTVDLDIRIRLSPNAGGNHLGRFHHSRPSTCSRLRMGMPNTSSTGQSVAIAVGPLALIGRILSMSSPRAVRLRSRSEDDFDVLFRIADDLATWEERSAASPAPLTGEAFRSRLAQSDADDSGKDVSFVIDVDGAAVGSVSLFDVDGLARHAEVGIALVPEARGKGIGSAAISQIVEFAFVRCNLRRVHLQVIESNLGAIRAYENAGFVVEGRQRQHAWVRGKYDDIVIMGILRSA